MRVIPFEPYHIDLLMAQGVQSAQVSHVPANYARFQKPAGASVTAFDGDRIIICGGIVPNGDHMGDAWALLSKDAGRYMLWLHRATRRFLQMQRIRRIEATVPMGFVPGCRWAKLLGFRFEGKMKAYGPEGDTHLRYALIR
jgi:hypothetical protein